MMGDNDSNVALSPGENSSLDPGADDLSHCPTFDASTRAAVAQFAFWVDGVARTSVAGLGLAGNLAAGVVLCRRSMRNSFNLLLLALAVVDSAYLAFSILEAVRMRFLPRGHPLSTRLLWLVPHFLYPANASMLTASIYMMVAIALERFVAVKYPLDYKSNTSHSSLLRCRVARYVFPVLAFSLAFNAGKFFESRIRVEEEEDSDDAGGSRVFLEVTALRTDPLYSGYVNFSRLIVLGLVPFAMLIGFNWRIFRVVRLRHQRRLAMQARAGMPSGGGAAANASRNSNGSPKAIERGEGEADATELQTLKAKEEEGAAVASKEAVTETAFVTKKVDNGAQSSSPPAVVIAEPPSSSVTNTNSSSTVGPNGERRVRQPRRGRRGSSWRRNQAAAHKSSGERRRRAEDRLAVVFMGFIAVFLTCHSLRLALDVHELLTMSGANDCRAAGRPGVPAWALGAVHLSHLLLVFNSATNILVYCGLSSRFRDEFCKIVNGWRSGCGAGVVDDDCQGA